MRQLLPLVLTVMFGASLQAQNTCETAVPISEGIYEVIALDGTLPPVSCFGFGTPDLGEWYSFTTPVDTGVVINTGLAQFPIVDTRVQVFRGACAALICIDSDDDSGTGLSSRLEFYATANVTYLIHFDDNWSTSAFHFELTLFPPPPPPVNLIDFSPMSIPEMSYSMGLVDMNNDQLDDLLAPSSNNVKVGYQQPDGSFIFTNTATPQADHSPSWSMCAGDLDKNGMMDLMYGATSGITFMIANADGTAYTERSTPNIFAQRTNMVDLNNDGHLDAFTCHDTNANVAFLNDGTGQLVYQQGGYGTTCGNYGSVFTDYNNDGLMDLFISKCGCDPKDLLMPNSPGGIFTNVAPDLGWDDNHQSWSSAWGDYDNDGDMDAFIGASSSGIHKLMRNNGDGTFTDITTASGASMNTGQSIEWTTHDFNNDGWLDILGGAGMLVNNGDGTFTMDNTIPSNGPVGDLNNDGYLDIVATGNTPQINQSSGNNWLRIALAGNVSNANGIGARVRVTTNGLSQIRDIKSGDGFRYMSSLMAHFGLAQATTATIEVRWPSGIVNVLSDVPANQVLLVHESAPTALQENTWSNLRVHPVPATDRITLSGATMHNAPIRIFSSTGQLVQQDVARMNTVDIHTLQSGVYLLEVDTPDGLLKARFVKE